MTRLKVEQAAEELSICSLRLDEDTKHEDLNDPFELSQLETSLRDNDVDLMDGGGARSIVIGSTRDDGKYYAGSDTWINKEAWELLMKAPTDSVFCRSAVMLYWSADQLRSRSVTGTLSNKCRALGRTVAKSALTPEKVSSLKGMLNQLKTWYH
ncbi:hypothetical protein MTO96_020021 [Rhipicephalus appendiculatus]